MEKKTENDSDDSLSRSGAIQELSVDDVRQEDLPSVSAQASDATRDRFMREMRSASKCRRNDAEDPREEIARRMSLTRELITELERDGPAGLVHIAAVSCAMGRPIRVWNSNDRMDRLIGADRDGEPVDIEYQQPEPGQSTGHWTLRGNVDPSEAHLIEPNGCLFAVLAAQTNYNPSRLRSVTVATLKRNIHKVADRIDELLWLKDNYKIALMLGGARYNGTSKKDTAVILNNSQNAHCHQCTQKGHPRGHASHPSATGPTDSVENYSRTGAKSGFLSRRDQDFVGHLALSHDNAQRMMASLNSGIQSVKVQISASELQRTVNSDSLPQARWWNGGVPISSPSNFRSVLLILRHHAGQQDNPNADVFVHTFYPII